MGIQLEKTVGSVTTEVDSTATVMEIVVPYSFKGKEFVTVYRYHDGAAGVLQESDTKADGTFRLDRENGLICIYTNKFSTYAIGYTQCYNLSGAVRYGRYTGEITISLLDEQRNTVGTCGSEMSGGVGSYSFTHIPKGAYYLSATWMENGRQVSLEKQINVS